MPSRHGCSMAIRSLRLLFIRSQKLLFLFSKKVFANASAMSNPIIYAFTRDDLRNLAQKLINRMISRVHVQLKHPSRMSINASVAGDSRCMSPSTKTTSRNGYLSGRSSRAPSLAVVGPVEKSNLCLL